jgi:Carboxypeptidase regulatory-like domain/TonB dependent receptor-like, beta-barrel/TonB-dependent Receptor Plug Domain
VRQISFVLVLSLLCLGTAIAQSPNATLNGIVLDSSGAAIVSAEVIIVNDATGVQYATKTNGEGVYVVINLPPGPYRIQVSKIGFKTLVKPDISLNVQDARAINFTLPIGATSETVTVRGGAPITNTENAAVSTVIDRHFVENLPLNGRSFNTLLQLTPGVVIASSNGNVAQTGQFSIAGQRTDTNNFLVDGVSANFGVLSTPVATGSGTGSAQAFSALGGTSSLVSVEALQEFRIETSSFAPEFGRSPGGQVILATRSGTNDFHGGVYNYFRNTVMDANDWFANQAAQPRAPEHHNDFGGYLGGVIRKDKTFFFASYEGARLQEPQTSVIHVPSSNVRTSSATPTQLVPVLDAYPLPNGPTSPGGFTAQFTGTFSNRAVLNAGSIRIDHNLSDRYSIFGRYNDAPSRLLNRVGGLSSLQSVDVDTQTLTVGLNMQLTNGVLSVLRGNYSTQRASSTYSADSFGGAVPVDAGVFLGSLPPGENRFLFQTFDTAYLQSGPNARNRTRQMNFAEDLSFTLGGHQLKFGADYRGIFLNLAPNTHSVTFNATSVQSLLSTNTASLFSLAELPSRTLSQSLSVYAQDSWKISGRLVITYGLRWELDPAPTALGSTRLASWINVNNPANIALAPFGSPAWETTYWNFAPRAGVAWTLDARGDLVLRAGVGIFYDPGVGAAASLAASFPNSASANFANAPVPIGNVSPYLPVLSVQPPFPNGISAYDPNLVLPRSYQWNVALEKSFGEKQVVSATYAGQAGRNLLRQEAFYQPNGNFPGEDFLLTTNDARSNYNSLQLQYRRSLFGGLQAIANYTWSHSLDNASNDVAAGLPKNLISGSGDYGSSDFDVRQSFSAALTYAAPAAAKSQPLRFVTRDWSVSTVIVAHAGFPFNALVVGTSPDLGGFVFTRPDLVAGQSIWVSSASAPGGKILNSNAFSVPSAVRQGTESRNDIPGFGLTQVDVSIHRQFPVTERLNLQFGADAFNVFNHPNFANPFGAFQFGSFYLQSVQMQNQALGGLNPLFQAGGPRSLQLSLKLSF